MLGILPNISEFQRSNIHFRPNRQNPRFGATLPVRVKQVVKGRVEESKQCDSVNYTTAPYATRCATACYRPGELSNSRIHIPCSFACACAAAAAFDV